MDKMNEYFVNYLAHHPKLLARILWLYQHHIPKDFFDWLDRRAAAGRSDVDDSLQSDERRYN